MRSSIARGALALLSVVAITGCQSGSTWSPTWWNPFHTTPATPFDFFRSGGAGPAFVAGHLVARSYGSGTTANPYSPYSSGTPSGYGATPNSYGSGSYGTLRKSVLHAGRIQRVERHYPGQL